MRVVLIAVVALALSAVAPATAAPPERQLLSAQLNHSTNVVRFFEKRGLWLRATRHDSCSGVPWKRSCVRARVIYRQHKREARRLKRQLWLHLPVSRDWQTSVRIVQRAFPGTDSWLLSCSGAEGGHSAWVTYGGGRYYAGFERTDIVGGPMQYRWSTFKGHYRHGLDSLRARGFRVDLPDPDDPAAFLSMTAQAIAAGWARWAGEDNSHWSASWGNGC